MCLDRISQAKKLIEALPCSWMDAEYKGYCGMGTRMASRESRMRAVRHMRTAGLAPSVMKICCNQHGLRDLPSCAPRDRS